MSRFSVVLCVSPRSYKCFHLSSRPFSCDTVVPIGLRTHGRQSNAWQPLWGVRGGRPSLWIPAWRPTYHPDPEVGVIWWLSFHPVSSSSPPTIKLLKVAHRTGKSSHFVAFPFLSSSLYQSLYHRKSVKEEETKYKGHPLGFDVGKPAQAG